MELFDLPVVPDCPVNLTEPLYALLGDAVVLTREPLELTRDPLAVLLLTEEAPLLFEIDVPPFARLPEEVRDEVARDPFAATVPAVIAPADRLTPCLDVEVPPPRTP